MIKSLTNLGLSQTDANVYIYLATRGPQRAKNIRDALKLEQQILNKSLENLQGKGVVNFTLKQSATFFALPFDKALDLLVKAHLKKTELIEQKKNDILSKWQEFVEDSVG